MSVLPVTAYLSDGMHLDPQAILDHARSGASRSVVVLSATGALTRVHRLDNHFAWLAISLHLCALKGANTRGIKS